MGDRSRDVVSAVMYAQKVGNGVLRFGVVCIVRRPRYSSDLGYDFLDCFIKHLQDLGVVFVPVRVEGPKDVSNLGDFAFIVAVAIKVDFIVPRLHEPPHKVGEEFPTRRTPGRANEVIALPSR